MFDKESSEHPIVLSDTIQIIRLFAKDAQDDLRVAFRVNHLILKSEYKNT